MNTSLRVRPWMQDVDVVAVIAGPATETGLGTEIRVSLRTGDVLAKAPNSRDRLLLAGLGPLRSATRSGEGEVLLETLSGERWLVRMSPVSGLVAAVEPATSPPPAPRRSDRCVTVM